MQILRTKFATRVYSIILGIVLQIIIATNINKGNQNTSLRNSYTESTVDGSVPAVASSCAAKEYLALSSCASHDGGSYLLLPLPANGFSLFWLMFKWNWRGPVTVHVASLHFLAV